MQKLVRGRSSSNRHGLRTNKQFDKFSKFEKDRSRLPQDKEEDLSHDNMIGLSKVNTPTNQDVCFATQNDIQIEAIPQLEDKKYVNQLVLHAAGIIGQVIQPPRHLFTGRQILNLPIVEQPFLIDDILPSGIVAVFVGSSDTGKSLWSRQLCGAVALEHTHIFGRKLNCKFNRAAYLSSEDDIKVFKKHLTSWDLSEKDALKLENLHVICDQDRDRVSWLIKHASKTPYDLIVIDALADFINGDLNDAINVRKFFNDFNLVTAVHGTVCLFVHHINKKGENETASKASVLGSSAIESKSRCALQLKKDNNDERSRQLHIIKCNAMSSEQKSVIHKITLNEKLLFESSGETFRNSPFRDKQDKLVEAEKIENRAHELRKEGLSMRQIAEKMSEEGFSVGKTKVSEIVKVIAQPAVFEPVA